MKRIIWLFLLAVALPMTSFASSVEFTSSGGALTGSSAGLDLTGSTLTAVGSIMGNNLGSVFFATGALTSGSLQTGGTFAAGGAFQIAGDGANGVPNTLIFNGTFSGPLTWKFLTLANGTHKYQLSGPLIGTWFTGETVNGTTAETLNVGTGLFNGTATSGRGIRTSPARAWAWSPNLALSPFFGTGLLALAGVGVFQRKLRA